MNTPSWGFISIRCCCCLCSAGNAQTDRLDLNTLCFYVFTLFSLFVSLQTLARRQGALPAPVVHHDLAHHIHSGPIGSAAPLQTQTRNLTRAHQHQELLPSNVARQKPLLVGGQGAFISFCFFPSFLLFLNILRASWRQDHTGDNFFCSCCCCVRPYFVGNRQTPALLVYCDFFSICDDDGYFELQTKYEYSLRTSYGMYIYMFK